MAENKLTSMAGIMAGVLTLGIVAIFLSISGIVVTGIQGTNTTVNYQYTQQITPVVDFNTTLTHPNIINGTVNLTFALGIAGNVSPAGFHLTQELGVLEIINTTASNTLMNFTANYTETRRDQAFNISNSGATGLLEAARQLPIFGIVIILVSILLIITGSLFFKGRLNS